VRAGTQEQRLQGGQPVRWLERYPPAPG